MSSGKEQKYMRILPILGLLSYRLQFDRLFAPVSVATPFFNAHFFNAKYFS
ncbi:hypothetical protein XSR1_260017 [Xenorhabdus szentirmaii DSM 16338]|uniref:Uncharacterized protein n=1 Tax=Xenorhabdus szentirmaii DSM 16338 TaxID=1427518 RepID=W1IYM2_9GAMM|nr:hypothetical protein XSR1_260017 [Xenorhabdus szentirmaii DSM 16338]